MLVTLARFLDPWEAHVVCARLRADGLFAEVANDRMAIVDWPMAYALGGTQLQVKAEDIAEARAIFDAYRRGELDVEHDSANDDAHPEPACTCPPQGPVIPWGERALVIALFVLGGATFPTRTVGGLCATCGKTRPA
ncbi:hypothetical protein LYSHEL_09410 [Lysobacter helvus]|uniref:DUF2007 domain-containing protein n=2 Tax=Lysobacteraceae TaxID=32033 RepID=A0ABM7Q3S4_9GAMM|nr:MULTISPECIES: hypothetical protein [Lysobacter]BCT91917.1 hypothetical protein LYSCAS_09410 [Lysobacter caseinilyticus]BCT95070.1 hypothetical protein LYSHEL_09410 [Lysobacter helvus]